MLIRLALRMVDCCRSMGVAAPVFIFASKSLRPELKVFVSDNYA